MHFEVQFPKYKLFGFFWCRNDFMIPKVTISYVTALGNKSLVIFEKPVQIQESFDFGAKLKDTK